MHLDRLITHSRRTLPSHATGPGASVLPLTARQAYAHKAAQGGATPAATTNSVIELATTLRIVGARGGDARGGATRGSGRKVAAHSAASEIGAAISYTYGWTPAFAARSTAPRLRLSSGRPAAWQRTLSSNLAGAALLQRRRAWNRHASADATAALGGRWPARGTSSVSRHASASRDSSAV